MKNKIATLKKVLEKDIKNQSILYGLITNLFEEKKNNETILPECNIQFP